MGKKIKLLKLVRINKVKRQQQQNLDEQDNLLLFLQTINSSEKLMKNIIVFN